MTDRVAGVLLHPTSLPGRWPSGDFGPAVDAFLDWAAEAGFGLWQILPLGPSAAGNSPYSSLSTFAIDPVFISPERLVEDGLLDSSEVEQSLSAMQSPNDAGCDFAAARSAKTPLLHAAWACFRSEPPAGIARAFDEFRSPERHRVWLDDWCLFAALRERYQGAGWWTWDESLVRRQPDALAAARSELAEAMEREAFLQVCAHRQWQAVRAAAGRHGIRILGDLPIYLALDSAEVWANQDLFELDDRGRPLAVAGVPPDYFSQDGQLWGNPLFRWQRMAERGFRFWIERLRGQFEIADLVRLDHFRGFAGYWRVPAGAENAREGTWEPGPGKDLFDAFEAQLGSPLPLIAEDLGEITDDVHDLRRSVGLPSMKVLHFGFGSADSIHAPHYLEPDTLVYTGTHDNDTTVGWFWEANPRRRVWRLDRRRRSLYRRLGGEIPWGLVEMVSRSAAMTSIFPVQDILGLGTEARTNTPGTTSGNWEWRLRTDQLTDDALERLRELSAATGRV